MLTRLDQILEVHRAAAAKDTRDLEALVNQAFDTDAPRNFRSALDGPDVAVISEVKRRSPSAGDLNLDLDPATLGRDYARGGAKCLSVLTDEEFFGGSVTDLQATRAAVPLPVLRKDFTVDERDIADARIMGADAVLLIVAALSDDELHRFSEQARQLSLTALVEIHDEVELRRAVAAGATTIGVNQRNLHTFEIDTKLALRVHEQFPGDVTSVAESGIRTPDDVKRLSEAGYDAVLIGTSLVTSGQAQAAVAAMVAAGQRH